MSDTLNRVIRRVFPNGTTRVVVGSIGIAGVTGDNVPGTSALLNFPRALTISGVDLVIADSGAHPVRVLYANQTLGTLIGTPGTSGATGDGGLGEKSPKVVSCAVPRTLSGGYSQQYPQD